MAMLGIEHLFLCAAGTAALLAADFFHFLALPAFGAFSHGFELIQEEPSSEKSVQRLGALGLTFDFDAAGAMAQDDAGGDFIHVLPAGAAGADEAFLEIRFRHAEARHALLERFGFIGGDGINRHDECAIKTFLR